MKTNHRYCFVALAMTGFLAVITTPVSACHDWRVTWRDHIGTLPNSSVSYTAGLSGTWSVTANFGGADQIAHGESRCVNSFGGATGALSRCDCRKTQMQTAAATNFSSIHGSGQYVCSGSLSVSCVSFWMFVDNTTQSDCLSNCASRCAASIKHDSGPIGFGLRYCSFGGSCVT